MNTIQRLKYLQCAICLALSLICNDGFGAAALSISSPKTNTIVTPGQTLTIKAKVTTGTYPAGIALVGEGPLGLLGPKSGSTPTYTLTVPNNAIPGTYSLSAVGVDSTGAMISSAAIKLDVEPIMAPTALIVEPTSAHFQYVGYAVALTVKGVFGDCTTKNLTRSTNLSIVSQNTGVAVVNGNSIVAAGVGNTQVLVTYSNGPQYSVDILVPSSIVGDLNGDGKIDNNDVTILNSAIGSAISVSNDARDINHDGKITAADVNALKLLCNNPNCAIQ